MIPTPAAGAVRAVLGYAVGWGMIELSALILQRELGTEPVSDFERTRRLVQAIPPTAPAHLAEVAR